MILNPAAYPIREPSVLKLLCSPGDHLNVIHEPNCIEFIPAHNIMYMVFSNVNLNLMMLLHS